MLIRFFKCLILELLEVHPKLIWAIFRMEVVFSDSQPDTYSCSADIL